MRKFLRSTSLYPEIQYHWWVDKGKSQVCYVIIFQIWRDIKLRFILVQFTLKKNVMIDVCNFSKKANKYLNRDNTEGYHLNVVLTQGEMTCLFWMTHANRAALILIRCGYINFLPRIKAARQQLLCCYGRSTQDVLSTQMYGRLRNETSKVV